MERIICAIEQELKYTSDLDGNVQYQDGYRAAMTAIRDLLLHQTKEPRHRLTPRVSRLLSFLAAAPGIDRWETQPNEDLTCNERSHIHKLLLVLRSGAEEADFLSWWLSTYGIPDAAEEAGPAILPGYPSPTTTEALDWLEEKCNSLICSLCAPVC